MYKQRLSEQILDKGAIKKENGRKPLTWCSTECLLSPFRKVMEKMVGKGHFQGPGGPCRIRPDAPAAGEPEGAEDHGTRLTAAQCQLLWTSHGGKTLMDQYVFKRAPVHLMK